MARPTEDPELRFLNLAEMLPSGCVEWRGGLTSGGYGKFHSGGRFGKTELAHRAAWRLFKAPLPPSAFVLHTCDNRRCVNPDHLRLGTQKDNIGDMWSKARANPPRGQQHHAARLTESAVREILRSRDSLEALASRFGVHPRTVRDARERKTWRHVHVE